MLLSFLRIQIFEIVRVVTMILRIAGAVNYTNALKGKASISENLIIAEQVRLSSSRPSCLILCTETE